MTALRLHRSTANTHNSPQRECRWCVKQEWGGLLAAQTCRRQLWPSDSESESAPWCWSPSRPDGALRLLKVKCQRLPTPVEPPDPLRRESTSTLWTPGCCQVIFMTLWNLSTCMTCIPAATPPSAPSCQCLSPDLYQSPQTHPTPAQSRQANTHHQHGCCTWALTVVLGCKAPVGVRAVAITTINESQTFLASECRNLLFFHPCLNRKAPVFGLAVSWQE